MQSPMATEKEEKPSVGSFISGQSIPEQIYNATTSLQKARQDGFDYVVTALPNTVPLLTTSGGVRNGSSNSGGVRTDVTRLESKWWSTSVVGMVVDPPQWNNTQQTKSKQAQTPSTSYDNLQGIKLRDALTSTFSTDTEKKVEATKIFWGMLEWSAHMNIPAVILPSVPLVEKKIKSSYIHSSDEEDMFAEDNKPCPAVSSIAVTEKKKKLSINNLQSKEYTRLISNISTSSICTSSHVQLWIRVPLTIQSIQSYQLLLSKCNYISSVGCILCVDHTTPINSQSDLSAIIIALHGLIGSGHIKAISWNINVFLMNKKGYPTLSKFHQAIFSFIYGRLGRTLRTLLEGSLTNSNNVNSNMNAGTSLRLHHLQYLRHLRSKSNLLYKLDNTEAILETPYLDNLQSPLQPLGDHLEYQTYETFEKDPVKYRNYGLAVEYALLDGLEENKFSSVVSSNDIDLYEVTILVVGAGRGPLVRESISAVSRVSASLNDTKVVGMQQRKKGLHAKIIAIEKNPSAVLYLQSLKGSDPSWNGGRDYDPYNSSDDQGRIDKIVPGTSDVSVIGCDMREANSHPILKDMIDNVKSRGDIVVSELLGSFGDNELSPECLDGVQQCGILKDDCVSIPQNYTAFIAPVSSARLYCEARNQSCFPLNTNEGPASPSVGMQRALETPYVVRSHAASQTHAEQACWTYTHPHQSKTEGTTSSKQAAMNINNDRHAHLSFQHDPTHGVGFGCGYGALDSEVVSMASSTNDNHDTTITLHGLLGSFHSVLYESKKRNDKSTISIAPASFSVGMFSWFPLYFPLKEPLRVPNKATVNCSIWRRSDNERVWYEWCAEVVSEGRNGEEEICWASSSMHNAGGRSYHVKK